jgi:dolichyl-phosphate-mannose-protein mannosyltransferase
VVSEEKVEFRDENGNLLNEEQVKALEGKVSFSTRYETRTRLVDEAGNEIYEGVVVEEGEKAVPEPEAVGNAGTIAEGSNLDTQDALGENEANTVPPQAAVKEDLKKEASVEDSVADVPEPESDAAGKSTGREEL